MWKPTLQGPAPISLEGAMQAAKEQTLTSKSLIQMGSCEAQPRSSSKVQGAHFHLGDL